MTPRLSTEERSRLLASVNEAPACLMLANFKGGVGKSLTTIQLAAALARLGLRVLVIDFDPQANATRRLGIEMDPANPIPTASEVIAANETGVAEDAVVACGWADDDGNPTAEAQLIDVVPARYDLINREGEAGNVGAIRRLQKALTGEWLKKYDVVLIDTRPDLGHLVQMAMAASNYVLLITDAAYDGIDGAMKVAAFVEDHADDLYNSSLRVGGVVVSGWDNTNEEKFQLENLRGYFGDKVWELGIPYTRVENGEQVPGIRNWIPKWNRLKEADGAAVSLSAWNDKKARETVELFDVLAERVLREFLTTEVSA
ncbi:ParA family protein [Promicromonospora sp. Marseille-Q5078]